MKQKPDLSFWKLWNFIGVNPYFFSIRYSAKILAALSTLAAQGRDL